MRLLHSCLLRQLHLGLQSNTNISIFSHLLLFYYGLSICPALKQEGKERTEGNHELFQRMEPDIKSINRMDWSGKSESEMMKAWASHWWRTTLQGPTKCSSSMRGCPSVMPSDPISMIGFLNCLCPAALCWPPPTVCSLLALRVIYTMQPDDPWWDFPFLWW